MKMKKAISLLLVLVMFCFTACSEEKWHPETTEVEFDTQQLTVEKLYEATDLGSGEMDYYKVTATAENETSPYYSLTLSALIGIKFYPADYPNIRDESYSGYAIEEIRDVQFYGGGEDMRFMPLGNTNVFTEILASDTAVLWGNGCYEAQHDKQIKNISDYLPGMFFNYETTIKEYFRTEQVSMFVKLYVEEIISCTPREYHLQIACTDDGVTFG